MYTQQSSIDPSLAALLQTAQMVTPDQTLTVAAKVAQAAQQKMQPQGIAQGMPQARQEFQQAMPSMMRNMQQQQMQQMVQQAMQQKPAGIEGLQSNVRMADGGVVGYAGPEGSFVGGPRRVDVSGDIPIYAPREDKESGETETEYRARKAREAEEAQGERPIPRGLRWIQENILRPMSQAGGQRMAEMRGTPETPAASPAPIRAPQYTEYTDANRGRLDAPAGPVAAAPAPQAPAPRPPAQRPPAPAQTEPQAGIAALPAAPALDKSGIATAGKPITEAAADREARMRSILSDREKMAAGMADLSAEGIAALQEANRARQELLGKQRGDDKFNRQMALLRGFQGDRAAYDRAVAGQQARDEAANQAQLMHQQAVLKLREAQQAKQLGQFDRAMAFEQQAAELEGKARASSLEAQRIAASLATSEYSGLVNVRGQDIQAREGELNRAQNERLERIRRATANQPGEAERIFNEYTRRKAIDPKDAENYLETIDRIKGSGRGTDIKETSNELRALKDEQQDQLERLKSAMTDSQRKPILDALDKIAQRRRELMGAAPTSAEPPLLPPQAVSQLKEGVVTKFANGQQWTLKNGQPTQVK